MQQIKKCVSALIMAVLLAACLSGCRQSPTLVDNVYEENAKEIDSEQIMVDHTENAEQDDTIESTQQDQMAEDHSEQEMTESQMVAVLSPEADRTDATSDVKPTDEATSANAVTGGDGDQQERDNVVGGEKGGNTQGTGEGDGTGENQRDASDTSDNQSSGQDDTPSSGDDDTGATDSENTEPEKNPENDPIPSDQPGDSGVPAPTVKDVPRKIVTDGNGVERDIPKDVYTVTAVGDAAPIVEMIGGSGRLLATSQSFTDTNGLGYALCSDVQSGQVQTWWYEDGTNPIEDAYFQELLRQSPDVCFEVSGQTTFTSEQIAELQAHGIGYVPLPDLTSLGRMKDAVTIVANTLEINTNNGIDARRIAQQYCDWVDNAIAEVNRIRPSYTYGGVNRYTPDLVFGCFYVAEWRDDITFQRMFDPAENNPYVELPGMEGGYGAGVALCWTWNKRQPLWEIERSIWILPCDSGFQPSQESVMESYVFPYEGSFGIPVFSDDRFYYPYDMVYYNEGLTSDFCFSLGAVSGTYGDRKVNNTNHVALGHERYPALVVANDFVRNRIQNSPQWKAGYSPDKTDNPIYGDYVIYVNPVGFRNWAEGGLDSPLEAYWLGARITGTIDENILYNRIQSFYESFFGVRLSDSQISAIINR